MKICKKCGEVNKNNSPICENANCYGNDFEDYEYVKNIANNKLAYKSRLKKIISFSVIILYIIIIIFLMGINAFKGTLTFSLVLGSLALILISIMCIRFTTLIFLITHIFSINNVDENNMSDMFYTYIKILGIGLALYSIILLVKSIGGTI